MANRIPQPWLDFLLEVDRRLEEPLALHCLGGFVLHCLWGLQRPTGDVDFVAVVPGGRGRDLLEIAGDGTELAARYKLRLHQVTVAECPEAYATRLIDLSPPGCGRLKLLALEVHDLVLAKVGRNSPRDRADVKHLATRGVLDPRVLAERFEAELKPFVLNAGRDALTLDLWLDEFFPGSQPPPRTAK